jgi:hypothetical protein
MVMARWFFVNAFVRPLDATQCSGSADTATADNVIAATFADPKPVAGSDAAPTAATSEARKDSSIIVTGSGDIAIVAPA